MGSGAVLLEEVEVGAVLLEEVGAVLLEEVEVGAVLLEEVEVGAVLLEEGVGAVLLEVKAVSLEEAHELSAGSLAFSISTASSNLLSISSSLAL